MLDTSAAHEVPCYLMDPNLFVGSGSSPESITDADSHCAETQAHKSDPSAAEGTEDTHSLFDGEIDLQDEFWQEFASQGSGQQVDVGEESDAELRPCSPDAEMAVPEPGVWTHFSEEDTLSTTYQTLHHAPLPQGGGISPTGMNQPPTGSYSKTTPMDQASSQPLQQSPSTLTQQSTSQLPIRQALQAQTSAPIDPMIAPIVSYVAKEISPKPQDEENNSFQHRSRYPFCERPSAWSPHGTVGKPLFRYSSRGQWAPGYFTTQALRFYISRCPRNLTVWLQSVPYRTQRQDSWDRMCRWSECPDRGNPIRPGFYRCTFDEFPQLTQNAQKDPYFTAGCMHLYCFEQIFDISRLYGRRRLVPDARTLQFERGPNPMALNRGADKDIVDKALIPWMNQQPKTDNVPMDSWKPLAHRDSLGFALSKHHLTRSFKALPEDGPDHMEEGADNSACLTIGKHMGDLKAFLERKKTSLEKVKSPSSKIENSRKASTSSVPLSINTCSTEDGRLYEVEEILEERKHNGVVEYLVKWHDFSDHTWERRSALEEDLGLQQLHDLLPPKRQSKLARRAQTSRRVIISGNTRTFGRSERRHKSDERQSAIDSRLVAELAAQVEKLQEQLRQGSSSCKSRKRRVPDRDVEDHSGSYSVKRRKPNDDNDFARRACKRKADDDDIESDYLADVARPVQRRAVARLSRQSYTEPDSEIDDITWADGHGHGNRR